MISKNVKPVNSVLVCIASLTVFGLYYAVKFQKIRVWTLLYSSVMVLNLAYDTLGLPFYLIFVIQIVILVGLVQCMFKESTQYNQRIKTNSAI